MTRLPSRFTPSTNCRIVVWRPLTTVPSTSTLLMWRETTVSVFVVLLVVVVMMGGCRCVCEWVGGLVCVCMCVCVCVCACVCVWAREGYICRMTPTDGSSSYPPMIAAGNATL